MKPRLNPHLNQNLNHKSMRQPRIGKAGANGSAMFLNALSFGFVKVHSEAGASRMRDWPRIGKGTMRRITFACCLLLLIGSGRFDLKAQQPSSSGGDEFNASSPYAGLNPLDGRPETFPASGNPPRCIPPVKTWKLIAQQNGQCNYFEPAPINGYITSINNVGKLQKFYVKCGEDPFDPTNKVICQNPGDDLPGAKPTAGPPLGSGVSATGRNGEVFSGGDNEASGNQGISGGPNDPTASTGNYRRQPAPPAYDPCHPNYNMSTTAGRAAAQQNAAQTLAACNEERCKHNPQLDVCGGPPPEVYASAGDKPCTQTPTPKTFSQQQQADIKTAVADAKAMLEKARPKVVDWDEPTRNISYKWFGNYGKELQEILLARIDGELALISNINTTNVNANFAPGSLADVKNMKRPKSIPISAVPLAYVKGKDRGINMTPMIQIMGGFFDKGTTGPDSMATIIVHELSHIYAGGYTSDVDYGQSRCALLVPESTALGQAYSALNGQQPVASDAPSSNADSFKYFVYYTSIQK
jgi:hypothetical protein